MYRNSFFACILTFASLFILMATVGSAQSDKVKASMAALKAETAKLGAPKVEGSDLYFGKTKASNELVAPVVKKHGGAATLFIKKDKEYVRVATTVKRENGKSAVGTALDSNSSAIGALDRGEPYYGDAKVFGKTYDAGYEPIKGSSGAVIGAYFVGEPKK
jgi:Cache 3/Cache 2 fusion domain